MADDDSNYNPNSFWEQRLKKSKSQRFNNRLDSSSQHPHHDNAVRREGVPAPNPPSSWKQYQQRQEPYRDRDPEHRRDGKQQRVMFATDSNRNNHSDDQENGRANPKEQGDSIQRARTRPQQEQNPETANDNTNSSPGPAATSKQNQYPSHSGSGGQLSKSSTRPQHYHEDDDDDGHYAQSGGVPEVVENNPFPPRPPPSRLRPSLRHRYPPRHPIPAPSLPPVQPSPSETHEPTSPKKPDGILTSLRKRFLELGVLPQVLYKIVHFFLNGWVLWPTLLILVFLLVYYFFLGLLTEWSTNYWIMRMVANGYSTHHQATTTIPAGRTGPVGQGGQPGHGYGYLFDEQETAATAGAAAGPFKLRKPIADTLWDDALAQLEFGLPLPSPPDSSSPDIIFRRGYSQDGEYIDLQHYDIDLWGEGKKDLQLHAADPRDLKKLSSQHKQLRNQFLNNLDIDEIQTNFVESLRTIRLTKREMEEDRAICRAFQWSFWKATCVSSWVNDANNNNEGHLAVNYIPFLCPYDASYESLLRSIQSIFDAIDPILARLNPFAEKTVDKLRQDMAKSSQHDINIFDRIQKAISDTLDSITLSNDNNDNGDDATIMFAGKQQKGLLALIEMLRYASSHERRQILSWWDMIISAHNSIVTLQEGLKELRKDIIARRNRYWLSLAGHRQPPQQQQQQQQFAQTAASSTGPGCITAWRDRLAEYVKFLFRRGGGTGAQAWDCTQGAWGVRVSEIAQMERQISFVLDRLVEALMTCSID